MIKFWKKNRQEEKIKPVPEWASTMSVFYVYDMDWLYHTHRHWHLWIERRRN